MILLAHDCAPGITLIFSSIVNVSWYIQPYAVCQWAYQLDVHQPGFGCERKRDVFSLVGHQGQFPSIKMLASVETHNGFDKRN